MITRLSIILLIACSASSIAQIITVPIPRTADKKKSPQARTKELTPMMLPFWDDFSFSNNKNFPHDSLWQDGRSVWVNTGEGINPPSIGVATFDGLDSASRPYNVNDVLAKGIADKLISRPIRLDLVPLAERSTVYLSYYYQFHGNGEAPDAGDYLAVQFKDDQGEWETAFSIENDGTLDPTVFTQILIPITANKFYHDSFQFRFQSFGRLSGPYDTWHIDYVFLNKGRSATDTSYPDRTIVYPLTSLFKDYSSIPLRHFLEAPTSNLSSPILSTHNLEIIPGNTTNEDQQPINFKSSDSVAIYRNSAELIFTHEQDTSDIIVLNPLEFKQTEVLNLPDLSAIAVGDSAATIKFKLWVKSGDNVIKTATEGDYDSVKYYPIDFRWNDTTRINYHLSNFYAYDDGNAEYGAGLNQPGARLAYKFDLRKLGPDTIVALDFYFPKFGDETTQSIEVQVLRDLTGDPGANLYKESTIIQRNSNNHFWRYIPSRFIGVQGSFYVGWRQLSSATIAVGLDKNTNTGEKIYFNVNGTWEQNQLLSGSLMIRPVFGKGDGVITGLEELDKNSVTFYPNPSHGVFYVSASAKSIQVFDISGKESDFTVETLDDRKVVTMNSPRPGIYILRLFTNQGQVSIHRLMVR